MLTRYYFPVRPHLGPLLPQPPIIAISLPSSSGSRGTDTLVLALNALSCKLCHFNNPLAKMNAHLLIKLFCFHEPKRRHGIRLLDYNNGDYRRRWPGSESRFTMGKLDLWLTPRWS